LASEVDADVETTLPLRPQRPGDQTMRIEHADPARDKGWLCGPWDSSLPIAVGYANRGVDEPHFHARTAEIYLVARGTAEVRVEQVTVGLSAGDLIVIEPGEAHTFISSSPDYFHFVVHAPGLSGETAKADKISTTKARMRL
jgi:mannose-6-phosphate isomerase-like protein (cupin superfamily)